VVECLLKAVHGQRYLVPSQAVRALPGAVAVFVPALVAYGATLERAGLSESLTTYTYDDNGSTLTRSKNGLTDTYTWDYRNRLVAALNETVDGSDTTFTYDVDGIRIAKTVAGESDIAFLVDKNRDYAQVLTESIDPAGPDPVESVTYVYGDDLLTMTRPESGTSYYHYDGQTSTRVLTNALSISSVYSYDAFGDVLCSHIQDDNNYIYVAEQYDVNVGMHYLRARYYHSSTARFTSSDFYQGVPADPNSLHKYAYANANPIAHVDRSGELAVLGFAVILGAVLGFFFGSITVAYLLARELYTAANNAQQSWATANGIDCKRNSCDCDAMQHCIGSGYIMAGLLGLFPVFPWLAMMYHALFGEANEWSLFNGDNDNRDRINNAWGGLVGMASFYGASGGQVSPATARFVVETCAAMLSAGILCTALEASEQHDRICT